MKYRIIAVSALISCLLLHTIQARAQQFEWALKVGGGAAIDSRAIKSDKNGNIYTAGNFQGSVDFDPGIPVFNLSAMYAGMYTISGFITKSDSSGNFLWARQQGRYKGYVYTMGMSLDPSGNVYTMGTFTGLNNFNPGTNAADTCWMRPLLSYTETGGPDNIFISKLDAEGGFKWARQIGTINLGKWDALEPVAIATDAMGNVYLAGNFRGAPDFDPGRGEASLPWTSEARMQDGKQVNHDIFILKLDTDGNFLWVKGIGGLADERVMGMTLDASGNIYATGYFQGTLDFNPGTAVYDLKAQGLTDAFVLKLNTHGNFVWAKQVGGYGDDTGNNITLSKNGEVAISGTFNNSADFDPGPQKAILTAHTNSDIFVLKLTTSGNYIWARHIGKNRGNIFPAALASDTSGDVYLAGTFVGTMDFDPGTEEYNLSSSGIQDFFITKMYADGGFAWVKALGGKAAGITGTDILISPSKSIYSTGMFSGTVNFDPGTGAGYNLSATVAKTDMFLHKMSTCYRSGQVAVTACKSYTIGDRTFTESGIYPLTIPGVEGCDSSLSLDLTINKIDVSVSYAGNTLTANETAATYQWIECSNGYRTVAGGKTQSFKPERDGSYAVIITKGECKDTSECFNIASTDIKEQTGAQSLTLYPNPGKDRVNMKVGKALRQATIRWINVMGQTVCRQPSLSGTVFSFNVASLPAGIYTIELAEEGNYTRVKWIKTGY